jgi:hypothetical protein
MPMKIVARETLHLGEVKWCAGRSRRPADQLRHREPQDRPGTIAFQAHDPFSITACANIRIKLTK